MALDKARNRPQADTAYYFAASAYDAVAKDVVTPFKPVNFEKLPEVFRESNSYYVLGFNPAHADGRFHEIKVKVGRRDVILQARRGYYAAGGKPQAPKSDAGGSGIMFHE